MSDDRDTRGQEAIESFAADLEELRQQSGGPSFRTLARRSGCISHSTLHEATKGYRMPSWETTEQFVRSVDGDVEQWRQRWEAASATAEPDAPVSDGPESAAAEPVVPAAAVSPEPPTSRGESSRPSSPVITWVAAAVVAVLLLGAGVLIGRLTAPEPVVRAAEPTVIDGYRAGDDIEDMTALHPGDVPGAFEDVTLPDGTEVAAGERVEKTWSIENAGSVEWTGRSMVRTTPVDASGAACETPLEVDIPQTAPGEIAEITVPIDVKGEPGAVCRVEWKMVDENGNSAFPDGRPIFFLLYVA